MIQLSYLRLTINTKETNGFRVLVKKRLVRILENKGYEG